MFEVAADWLYQLELIKAEAAFWERVQSGIVPVAPPVPLPASRSGSARSALKATTGWPQPRSTGSSIAMPQSEMRSWHSLSVTSARQAKIGIGRKSSDASLEKQNKRRYNNLAKIEFDPAKRQVALDTRGLDFADAAMILEARTLSFADDRRDYGEVRIVTFGHMEGRLVACVWTERDGKRRIISLRKPNDDERSILEEHA